MWILQSYSQQPENPRRVDPAGTGIGALTLHAIELVSQVGNEVDQFSINKII